MIYLALCPLFQRWAVDANKSACESLRMNHPETQVSMEQFWQIMTRLVLQICSTLCRKYSDFRCIIQVRNETAEDFLELLKGWEKLCQWCVFSNLDRTAEDITEVKNNEYSTSDVKSRAGEYEVQRLVDICYGDTGRRGKRGLKFKVPAYRQS